MLIYFTWTSILELGPNVEFAVKSWFFIRPMFPFLPCSLVVTIQCMQIDLKSGMTWRFSKAIALSDFTIISTKLILSIFLQLFSKIFLKLLLFVFFLSFFRTLGQWGYQPTLTWFGQGCLDPCRPRAWVHHYQIRLPRSKQGSRPLLASQQGPWWPCLDLGEGQCPHQ